MPWTLGELLGEGGFGRVYECLNDDGTICAAKVVPLKKGDDARAQAARAEIEKEVEVMRKLHHPNIVRYLGTEKDEKSLIIFLELVPGGSIATMLGKYGKFKEPIIQGYTREILQGLQYLHSNKILHRDIKGPNILVDHQGVCKLSDFGCSKELYGEVSSANTLKGTPQFMAPEVLLNQGRGYTDKADVWSVGCTVVEMATGASPWPQFTTNEAVMFHVATQSLARPETPSWLSETCGDFLSKCFAREPETRASVEELLQHGMVAHARLAEKQRLGSRTADPLEISLNLLELERHMHMAGDHQYARRGGSSGLPPGPPQPADGRGDGAAPPGGGGGGGGRGHMRHSSRMPHDALDHLWGDGGAEGREDGGGDSDEGYGFGGGGGGGGGDGGGILSGRAHAIEFAPTPRELSPSSSRYLA